MKFFQIKHIPKRINIISESPMTENIKNCLLEDIDFSNFNYIRISHLKFKIIEDCFKHDDISYNNMITYKNFIGEDK